MMRDFLFWLSRKIGYPLLPPQVMQVSLTYRCNLRCKMCGICGLLPQEDELSTSQLLHAVDEAFAYGIKEVLLTGGEPFLRKDWARVCRYCLDKGLRSIITTNGTLIDEALTEEISVSGVSHIHISLDGLEKTNDFFRGEGSFKKAIEGITLLAERKKRGGNFSIGIACTVMDNNINELAGLVSLADRLGVDVINFQPLVSDNANFMENKLPPFWVQSEHIPELREEINRIKSFRTRHITVYEEPRLELLADYYGRNLSRSDWACFGGFKTVFICYEKGQPLVYSCHGVCGNLDKNGLKSSWLSKEAGKLRLHSRECRQLCLQSCYSRESAQSLANIFSGQRKKGKDGRVSK